jgi:hypothetical protein
LGASAVYHDDENSGVIVYGNVFYNTQRVLLLGGGRDNTFDNNLMINNSICIYVDGRGLPGGGPHNNETLYKNLAAVPYKSPPWSTQYPSLASIQSFLSGHNVFEKVYSKVASQMVDPKNLNFQFVKDAAILQENGSHFVRIPFEQIGFLHDKPVGA